MAIDPAKIDLLVGKLTQAIERLEHLEIKLRAAPGGGAPADAVDPTQRGVADAAEPTIEYEKRLDFKGGKPYTVKWKLSGFNRTEDFSTRAEAQRFAAGLPRPKKDAAGGYAPIEPHQAGFAPEARADAARRKR